jgi:hypothetical protein
VAYYDTIPEPHTFALIAFGSSIDVAMDPNLNTLSDDQLAAISQKRLIEARRYPHQRL